MVAGKRPGDMVAMVEVAKGPDNGVGGGKIG